MNHQKKELESSSKQQRAVTTPVEAIVTAAISSPPTSTTTNENNDASLEFITPQYIMDQREKELERNRRIMMGTTRSSNISTDTAGEQKEQCPHDDDDDDARKPIAEKEEGSIVVPPAPPSYLNKYQKGAKDNDNRNDEEGKQQTATSTTKDHTDSGTGGGDDEEEEEVLSPQYIMEQRAKEIELNNRNAAVIKAVKSSVVSTKQQRRRKGTDESTKASKSITDSPTLTQQQQKLQSTLLYSKHQNKEHLQDNINEYSDTSCGGEVPNSSGASAPARTSLERGTPLSLPGAYRHGGGPSFDEELDTTTISNINCGGSDDQDQGVLTSSSQRNETMTSSYTTSADSGFNELTTSDDTRRRISSRSSGRSSLIKANMVDDAEPIFYAEDAIIDQSRRRFICGICFLVLACFLVIALTSLLMSADDLEGEICPFDEYKEVCCSIDLDDLSNPKVGASMCYCLNTTEGIIEGMDEVQLQVYNQLKTKLIDDGIAIDQDEINSFTEPGSCHAVNQALLFASQYESLELAPDVAGRAPAHVVMQYMGLLTIYSTMNGLNWTQGNNWYETSFFCRWFGVHCIFTQAIGSLRLPENGLVGSLPTEVGYMISLRELDLSGNSGMKGPLPSEISALTSLNLLDLSGSPFGGSVPSALGNLTALNSLELNTCGFSGTIPEHLFHLKFLRFLSLANNDLDGKILSSIENLSGLDMLRLDGNKLTGSLPTSLERLTNLGLLSIARNHFSGVIPDFLGRMPSLLMIDLTDSGLRGAIPESFCSTHNESMAVATSNGLDLRQRFRSQRRIVVNCTETELCSCCDPAGGNAEVSIICGERLPEQAAIDRLYN